MNALGIRVQPSPASRYRTVALLVWLAGVAALFSIRVLSAGAVTNPPAAAWLGALGLVLVWQAALVRLSSLSSGDFANGGTER